MDAAHFYEPSQGHGLPHDPFNAIVGPRPIGWISTRAQDGVLNLAPYSFFNAFNYTKIRCAMWKRPASSCGTW